MFLSKFTVVIKLIQIIFFVIYTSVSYAQDSGIKEIVKTHQGKIKSVEQTLKTLIGKIESNKNNSNISELKKISDSISLINDKLQILESKIQTVNEFSYRLEFDIKRLESHLNLSSSYSNKKKSLKNDTPQKPELNKNNQQISKEGLKPKSDGVLGFIKEKEKEKEKNTNEKNTNSQNKQNIKSTPSLNPDDQFKFAKSLLTKREYEKAEKAFQKFVDNNKKHKNTADAHYWLGRIFYIQKKYSEAAIALAEFNTLYPDDKRLQETTLLIAESATKFAPKEQICGILTQTRDFMTNPSKKFTKRITNLINKNNCPGE